MYMISLFTSLLWHHVMGKYGVFVLKGIVKKYTSNLMAADKLPGGERV